MIRPEEAKFFLCHTDIDEQKFPIIGVKNMNMIVQGPVMKFTVALFAEGLEKFHFVIRDSDGREVSIEDVQNWWLSTQSSD